MKVFKYIMTANSYFWFYKIFIVIIFSLLWINPASAETDKLKLIVNNYEHNLNPVSILDDKKIIFNNNGHIEIWDLKQKKLLQRLSAGGSHITVTDGENICFPLIQKGKIEIKCPDGKNINLKKLKILPIPITSFYGMPGIDSNPYPKDDRPEDTLSLGEKHVITKYSENSIKIWNKHSGKLVKEINGYNSHIKKYEDIEVKDNNIKALLEDGTEKLWDINSGKLLQTKKISTSNENDQFNSNKSKKYFDILKKIKINEEEICDYLELKKKFILTTSKGEIYFFDSKLKLIKLWKTNPYNSGVILFPAKDKLVIYLCSEKELFIFDLDKYQILSKIENFRFDPELQLIYKNYLFLANTNYSENSIYIWDLNTGKSFAINNYHSRKITEMLFYNEKLLYSSYDKTIKVWDFKSGKILYTLKDYNNRILKIDNGLLYYVSTSGKIKVIKFINGKELKNINTYNEEFTSLNIYKDKIIAVGNESFYKIWNIEKKQLLKALNLSSYQYVTPVLDKNYFYAINKQNQIEIFNLSDGKKFKTVNEKIKSVSSLISHNNQLIIIAEKVLKILDLKTFKVIKTIKVPNHSLISNIENGKLAFLSPSNKIQILDLEIGKVIKTFNVKSYVSRLVITDNKIIIDIEDSNKKYLTIWDINNKLVKNISSTVGFTTDKNKIYVGKSNGLCETIDLNTGKIIDIIGNKYAYNSNPVFKENNIITQLNIFTHENYDKKYFDNVIYFNDFKNNFKISQIGNSGEFFSLFIKDNLAIYDTQSKGLVNIVDLKTGKFISTLKDKLDINYSNIQIIDNKVFLNSPDIKIFDLKTGNLLRSLNIKNNYANSFIVNHNNLISKHQNGEINVWDYNSGRLINKIITHKKNIILLAIDDNRVVTLLNNEINIWSFKTGKLLNEIKLTNGENTDLYFAQIVKENLFILSGLDYQGLSTIRVWNLKNAKLIKEFIGYFTDIRENEFFVLDNNLTRVYDKEKLTEIYSYEIREKNPNVESFFIKDDFLFVKEKFSSEESEENRYNQYIKNKFWIWNYKTRKFINSFETHSDSIVGINEKIILTGTKDSGLAYWRLSDKKLLAVKYYFPNGIFTITPEGYFSGEGNYNDYLHLVKNNDKIISIESFKDKFYKPDLVNQILSENSIDLINLPKLNNLEQLTN